MTSKHIKNIMMLLCGIIVLLIIMFIHSLHINIVNNTPSEYALGEITSPGWVGVKVVYDKEPVDIMLLSPTGKRISKQFMDKYFVDDVKHVIYAYYDTEELGTWKLSINKKHNRSVQYTFLEGPSDKIHVIDVKITELNGLPYVEFTPIMDDNSNSKCMYSIIIENDKHSFSLKSGKVKLNKKAYVLINPSDAAFNNETYLLKLNVISITDDEKDRTSDHAQVEIVLPEKKKIPERPIGIQEKPEEDSIQGG